MLRPTFIHVSWLAVGMLAVSACPDEATTSGTAGDINLPDVAIDATAVPDVPAEDAPIPDVTPDLPGPDPAPTDEGQPELPPQEEVSVEIPPPVGCADDQCDIDGACIDNEAPNPENPCEVCAVLVDAFAWTANDAGLCDDDDACTTNDRCEEGACVADPVLCSDSNPCTDDSCDPESGECAFTNNTAPCLSATPCSAAICDGGSCIQTGEPKDCDDGNACTDDSCDDALGCVNAPNAGGCDDGNPCTTSDTCDAGLCVGQAVDCNDGDICTIDSCDASGECAYVDLSDQCTDDNPCTDEGCDPNDGCVYPFNTATCDDGSVCTENDVCDGGFCGGTPLDLDDLNPCTDDLCDPVTGPFKVNNTLPCEDGSVCTLGDLCGDGGCNPGGATLTCEDNELCTDDSCDPVDGCVFENNTLDCDDNSVCTQVDTCDTGACVGTDPIDCDDLNDCTLDTCDPIDGCESTLIVSNACRPNIVIDYPPRGATITGDFNDPVVTITGTVTSGAGPITAFTINGDPVTVNTDSSFSYAMDVAIGGNIFEAIATDSFNSSNERVQSFLWSDTFREPNAPKNGIVDPGLGIWLAQEVIDDGDHSLPADDLATIFEVVLASFDLSALIPNPVAEGVGGIPLSNATYTINLLNISSPGATVSVTAVDGGLELAILMTGPNGNGITADIQALKECTYNLFFDPLCIGPGEVTGDLNISSIAITTTILLSVAPDNTVLVTPQSTNVTIGEAEVTNLSFDIFGLITGVVNDLVNDLTADLGTQFSGEIDAVIAPLLGDAFGALAFNTSFDIPMLDGSGDVVTVDLVSDFSAVDFDPTGGMFTLRASGYSNAGKATPYDNDGIPGRRLCGTGAQAMVLPETAPLEIGLADNVLNAILYAAWDGGLLEFPVPPSLLGGVDLSAFGISNLNMVMSGMLAPTAMDCNAAGELIVHIGDLGISATMELFGNPLTLEVWLSFTAGIEVTGSAEGLGISLTEVKELYSEVNVAEDSGVAAEDTIKNLIETELVGGLLSALGGGALGNIPLPNIDLSSLVDGLPPGTGFSIVINGVSRDAGNTIIDGDLAGN